MAADNCKGQDHVPASLVFISYFLYTCYVLLLEEKTVVVWRMCVFGDLALPAEYK